MGHENIKVTLDVYGHLIEAAELGEEQHTGLLAGLKTSPCGDSVASAS
jgi:integrase